MSALPIPTSLVDNPTKAPPAPRGVQFIPLREACYRSGVPMETLARWCRDKWQRSNLAMLLKPADGGKASWHVREDADGELFARAKSPDALPFDQRDFTADQRRLAEHRKKMLDEWEEHRAEAFASGCKGEREATAAFVARACASGEPISRGTLYRWLAKYTAMGRRGLVDSRLKERAIDPGRKWFEQRLEFYYTTRRRSMQLSYDRTVDEAEDTGRPVPYGYDQSRRFFKSLDQKSVFLKREGSRAYAARRGRHIVRSHDIASNDLWMSDGHKFDVQVYHRGKATRPILISWMDVGSRMIVGYTIEARSETADAIRLSFKRAAIAYGTPVQVIIDNGASYDAEHLQGVTKAQRRAGEKPQIDLGMFPRLNIQVTHAKAYNAKAKGELERFHRTICDRFSCELPGYMGGNPIDKPHTYAAEVKAGKLLELEDFCQRFRDWLIADYHHRAHTGDGMQGKTPAAVFAERAREKRPLTADQIELNLFRRTRVTIGRNGASVKLHGATLVYEHPMLDSMFGLSVDVVLDDDQLSQAFIYRLDGSRLCVADAIARLPVNATPEQLREAMRSRRRDRQIETKAREVRMRIADDPAERMHRLALECEASSPVPMPDSLRPVRPADAPALRIADDEPSVGTFGYYSQFAKDSDKAVNE